MNSWQHAVASSRKWGGSPSDYIMIHEFLDSSKQTLGDVRHRAMYHHTQGVWLAQDLYGKTIEIKKEHGTSEVPVRLIAEKHIIEDLGWLPTPQDYLKEMRVCAWMSGSRKKTEKLEILGISL